MSGVNKVILVGHLGADPEMRRTKSDTLVGDFNLATTERFNDRNGERRERTEWHRIVVWAKLAEICEQYYEKGMQIYLEGRLQTRQWEDKNGAKRYTTEVVANHAVMLGSGPGKHVGDSNPPEPQGELYEDAPDTNSGKGDDDDLPF